MDGGRLGGSSGGGAARLSPEDTGWGRWGSSRPGPNALPNASVSGEGWGAGRNCLPGSS